LVKLSKEPGIEQRMMGKLWECYITKVVAFKIPEQVD